MIRRMARGMDRTQRVTASHKFSAIRERGPRHTDLVVLTARIFGKTRRPEGGGDRRRTACMIAMPVCDRHRIERRVHPLEGFTKFADVIGVTDAGVNQQWDPPSRASKYVPLPAPVIGPGFLASMRIGLNMEAVRLCQTPPVLRAFTAEPTEFTESSGGVHARGRAKRAPSANI